VTLSRLWWLRHAPTHARAFAGWRDVPADLSDHAAIARLDAHLPRRAVLVSSDLSRAVVTADALGRGRERLPHDRGLREFDFGEWDGLTHAEVSARWPDLSRRYWEEPGHTAAPGGESWIAAEARVSAAADALLAAYPGRDIIAVAHFGAILTQYARAAGLSPVRALAQDIAPLSVTRLAFDGAGWQVEAVNHRP
jgi:broad specificity phosphatase PhoE